jgi:general secretion pathway protein C
VIAGMVAGVAWRRSTVSEPRAAPEVAKVARSRGELLDSIKMVGNNRYEVPRSTVDQLLEDRLIAEDARIIPTYTDSVAVGYKIYAIRPRSVFHAIKLTDGDMLASIGGVALTSPEALAEVRAVVRSSQVVIVELIRRAEPVQITISIVD